MEMEFYSGALDLEDHTLSRINAQMQFLKAIRRHASNVLDELRDELLVYFRSAKLHESKPHMMPLYWFYVLTLGRGGSLREAIHEHAVFLKSKGFVPSLDKAVLSLTTERLRPLANGLWSWSEANGLDVDWVRQRAFFTLAHWVYNGAKSTLREHSGMKDSQNDWSYNHPDVAIPFELKDFTFAWAWHPARDSRSSITKIIRQRFKEKLQENLDNTEATFKEQTGIKTPLKRKHNEEHFHWLVLFQVKKMSYSEIVGPSDLRKGYLSDDTKKVRKAINDLARLIDLPLRSEGTRPGRRPKKNH